MKKPGEYNELFRSLGSEWKWLLGYISRYKLHIAVYVIMGIVAAAMGLGVSVSSKYLIDAVLDKNVHTIVTSAAAAVFLGLAQIVINAVISRVAAMAGTKISSEIRENIYEHIVFSKWESVRRYHSGDLLNRIEGDAGAVASSIVTFIPGVFTKLTQFVGCLALVLYYDPTMAIFAFLSTPFLALSSRITAKMTRKYNKESREMNGKLISFYSESIQNLQMIKAFDITSRYVEQIRRNLALYRKIRLDHDKFATIMTACMAVIGLIVSYACYGWGVWRLWNGIISFGTMTLFLQISGKLTASFSSLVSLAPSAISIATAAGRIMEITQMPLENGGDADKAARMSDSVRKNGVTIECENLTYTYDDGTEPVVKDVSFIARAGETIAFVGPSGEGKTTVLRLVLGLLEPDSGSIIMRTDDGETIKASESTRRFCSYVPQENAVFSGCIADNLRIVCPEASDDDLKCVLEAADAWSFIERLPLGIYTPVDEKGVNFSEGQIQRISIARALLRDAAVIVMDEATSALDAATEERVLANMMKAYPNRTRIITTHRPSMLRYCTRIYRISTDGTLTQVSAEEAAG